MSIYSNITHTYARAYHNHTYIYIGCNKNGFSDINYINWNSGRWFRIFTKESYGYDFNISQVKVKAINYKYSRKLLFLIILHYNLDTDYITIDM